MKYLKYIIIFVLIIIVLLVVLILNMSKIKNNSVPSNNVVTSNVSVNNINNNISNVSSNNVIDNEIDGAKVDGSVNHLRDYSMFFTVEDAVQKYLMLTNPGVKFRAVDMNYVSGHSLNQYGVYGNILETNGNVLDAYYIVNMEQGSLKYTIIPQNNVNSLSSIKLNIPAENEITNNSYQGKFVNTTDDIIIKKIMDDYKNLALNYSKTAYNMLDESYRTLRFKDYTEFQSYVINNANKIRNFEVISYNSNSNKTEYIVIDNYGNKYTIKLTGLMNYTIVLDDYTIMNEYSYALLDEQGKVEFNIRKIIKMINTCDYTNLYSRLNSTFKNSNFNTQGLFENYLKSNYYDYNIIDSIKVTKENTGVYICLVSIKNEPKVAANTVTKTIIMKLGNESNFEISFGM